jgi:sec-independent protein translocase protein TatB
MFGIDSSEFLLVALVALVVIGPKDLPKAMRVVGYWVGRARGVARQFRSGFDAMVREAELEEMEKKWAEENARIMREHPPTGRPEPDWEAIDAEQAGADAKPVMVEKPVVLPAADAATPDPDNASKANS